MALDRVEVKAALLARPENGVPPTYTDIGKQFGVTRERIRQLAKELIGETGTDRVVTRREIRVRAKRKANVFFYKWTFISIVRDMLLEIEHGYCSSCFLVKPIGDMTKTRIIRHPSRCKQCTAKSVRAYVNTPRGVETQRSWELANADKRREYVRRYQAKKRLAARAQRAGVVA